MPVQGKEEGESPVLAAAGSQIGFIVYEVLPVSYGHISNYLASCGC